MSILCARLPNKVLLPAVSLGTYSLEENDPNTITVIQSALKAGYRGVDTACFYKNERSVGAACRDWDQKVAPQPQIKPFGKWVAVTEEEFYNNFAVPHGPPTDNHKVFITSKCWVTHLTAQGVREQLEDHLKNEQRTMADLFILHWPGPHAAFDPSYEEAMKDPKNAEKRIECWRELEKLYHEKKIRVIGLSNYMAKHLKPIIDDVLDRKAKGDKNAILPMFDQLEVSPLTTVPKDLKDLCDKYEIQMGSYSTLGGGAWASSWGGSQGAKSLLGDKTLGEVSARRGRPVANVALRWALQHGLTVLPKSSHPDRVKSNFELFDFELTEEDMTTIDNMNAGIRCCPNPNEIA